MGYQKSALKFGNIADINNGHYLVFPEIDGIIRTVLEKSTSALFNRCRQKPESHETFRWVEESGMSRTAGFVDPRNITSTANAGITRVEKLATLKGMSNRINYGLFDAELTKNGTFPYVLQDDMTMMLTDMALLENAEMFSGNDTSYSSPTKMGYMGLLTAITNTATIPVKTTDSPRIAKAIKSQIAKMVARIDVNCNPTAIYMNPLTQDAMEIEENENDINHKVYTLQLSPGTTVNAIMTAAGLLPIVVDKRIPIDMSGATEEHPILIIDESKIVRHFLIGYDKPVVFKMGEIQTLLTEYVAVQFANFVCEFPDKAHVIMTKSIAKVA